MKFLKKNKSFFTVYLDLDGPILDFSQRSYRAYRDALNKKLGEKALSKKAYWLKKRNRVPLDIIYKNSKGRQNFKNFERSYLDNIESRKYLKFDKINAKIINVLKELNKHNRLVLVTLRKSRSSLMHELNRFKIISFFDKVLNHKAEENSYETKSRLILKDTDFQKSNSVIIGDTEADILSGKELGIKTIAVLNGIRSHSFLLKLKPGRIIKDITKLNDGDVA